VGSILNRSFISEINPLHQIIAVSSSGANSQLVLEVINILFPRKSADFLCFFNKGESARLSLLSSSLIPQSSNEISSDYKYSIASDSELDRKYSNANKEMINSKIIVEIVAE